MKIDRLLGIVTTLLQRDKATAPELAKMFEVSRRTIQRDIDVICQAGIPVITYPGGNGGIAIADGYRLDKSALTTDELQSIIAGLRGLDSITSSPRIGRLIAKLSPQGRPTASAQESILIDLSSHYRNSLAEKIALLREAISAHQLVAFDYYSERGLTVRTVEPYLILFKWTSWYLLGYCRNRDAFRLFKLNRLWHYRTTDESFLPRTLPAEELAVDDYFVGGHEITILFDRSVEHLVVEEYGPDSYAITGDDQLRLAVRYVNKDYILSWVLSFGDRAQVVSPAELANEVRDMAKKTALSYEHDR